MKQHVGLEGMGSWGSDRKAISPELNLAGLYGPEKKFGFPSVCRRELPRAFPGGESLKDAFGASTHFQMPRI